MFVRQRICRRRTNIHAASRRRRSSRVSINICLEIREFIPGWASSRHAYDFSMLLSSNFFHTFALAATVSCSWWSNTPPSYRRQPSVDRHNHPAVFRTRIGYISANQSFCQAWHFSATRRQRRARGVFKKPRLTQTRDGRRHHHYSPPPPPPAPD